MNEIAIITEVSFIAAIDDEVKLLSPIKHDAAISNISDSQSDTINYNNVTYSSTAANKETSSVLAIPSYEFTRKGDKNFFNDKKRCFQCSKAAGKIIYYEDFNINKDPSTGDTQCLNCYTPVETRFEDSYFNCCIEGCNKLAFGPCALCPDPEKGHCEEHFYDHDRFHTGKNITLIKGLL